MSQRSPDHTLPDIDHSFLEETLLQLMAIPSPVGLTDGVVRYTAARLEAIGLPYEVTRRGAIRATLRGRESKPARAIVTHLDTLGAMVHRIKPNGRLGVVPIGHWSARFAEETVASRSSPTHSSCAAPACRSRHPVTLPLATRSTRNRWAGSTSRCAWTCRPTPPKT